MSVLERPPPVGASRKFHVCGAKAVICGAGVCGGRQELRRQQQGRRRPSCTSVLLKLEPTTNMYPPKNVTSQKCTLN